MKKDRRDSPVRRIGLHGGDRRGRGEHRIARRAIALVLRDRGMRFEEVANFLLIHELTVRAWLKAFNEGGVEELVLRSQGRNELDPGFGTIG